MNAMFDVTQGLAEPATGGGTIWGTVIFLGIVIAIHGYAIWKGRRV